MAIFQGYIYIFLILVKSFTEFRNINSHNLFIIPLWIDILIISTFSLLQENAVVNSLVCSFILLCYRLFKRGF